MDWTDFDTWLSRTNLVLIAVVLFAAMGVMAVLGALLQRRHAGPPDRSEKKEGGQEGYVVSAVLGLLALLMGFTFSLAVDRFDARRVLVLQEANAIGTAYLRAQLLASPWPA